MSTAILFEHPNRDKAASRAARLAAVILLAASSVLLAVVSYEGWALMESARTVNLAFIALNLTFLVQVARWRRGVLPMAAAVAAFVGIFSGVSIGSWFARDADGYAEAALSADLGSLTVVILGVQVALIVVALLAFSQAWQVETEVHVG